MHDVAVTYLGSELNDDNENDGDRKSKYFKQKKRKSLNSVQHTLRQIGHYKVIHKQNVYFSCANYK